MVVEVAGRGGGSTEEEEYGEPTLCFLPLWCPSAAAGGAAYTSARGLNLGEGFRSSAVTCCRLVLQALRSLQAAGFAGLAEPLRGLRAAWRLLQSRGTTQSRPSWTQEAGVTCCASKNMLQAQLVGGRPSGQPHRQLGDA